MVQNAPSSQLTGVPAAHVPAEHVSFPVQALPSVQGAVLSGCSHPLTASQRSSVQTSPSLQSRAAPTHDPPLHVSPLVQTLWSSHGPGTGVPPRQTPFRHVSPTVQTLPSSQGPVFGFGRWKQPMKTPQ